MFGRKAKTQEQISLIEPVQEFEAVEPPKRPRKYELLPQEMITNPDGHSYPMHRIRALIDIPMHGVKTGDLGGYIYSDGTLDHYDSCWVGGNAIVMPSRNLNSWAVSGDALVTDNAFLSGRAGSKAKISDNAIVGIELGSHSEISGDCKILAGYVQGPLVARGNVKMHNFTMRIHRNSSVVIEGNIVVNNENIENTNFIATEEGEKVEIKGNAVLNNVTIKGNCHIDAEINLENVSFKGDNTVLGKPQIKPEVKFTGKNFISGGSLIPPGTNVHDVRMTGGLLDYAIPASVGLVLPDKEQGNPEAAPVGFSVSAAETQEYIDLIGEIESEYETYTTDIVKLIKYPAMVDTSIPEVGELVYNLRAAKRAVKASNADKIKTLAESLERAFLNAENKVQTLVSSHLDEGKKKSLKTAEKMFKLACDDASPEPEKRLSYKAGMRALEGIVLVSDKATENLKERIGILELEV